MNSGVPYPNAPSLYWQQIKTILKSIVLHEQSEKDEIREFAKS